MTRKGTQDTRTIQVWPGGQSYTYRGDPDGPTNRRSLRQHSYNGEPPKPWRKGTREEWRAIRIELRAEMYWERDGMGCDSALVDDLRKLGGTARRDDPHHDLSEAFGPDEIRNLYADPSDWDVDRCRAYADDNGLDVPPSDNDMDADEYLDALREVCRDHAQDNPAEVYEWWRVSGWLCGQLHAIGEVTIDNGYGHWWGRTCTGQSLLMDGTLQQIAAQYERDDDGR